MAGYTIQQILNNDRPLNLDPDFDGSCPCAEIEGHGFHVEVHCWRVCEKCEYSGVHISGDISKAEAVAVYDHIVNYSGWRSSTDWELKYAN